MGGNRVKDTDQFTVQIKDSTGAVVSTTATGATTTGGSNLVDAGSGTTGVYTATAGSVYTVAEAAASGSLGQYTGTVACSNSTSGGTDVSTVTALNQTLTPKAGDVISCTITNSPKAPTLKINQVISGAVVGVAPYIFDYNGTNGWSKVTLSSADVGYNFIGTSALQTLSAAGVDTTITPVLLPGWRVQTGATGTYCYDNNAAITGNSADPIAIASTATGITIPAALVKAGSDFNCVLGMELAPPTLMLGKALGGSGRINSADQFTVQIKNGTSAVTVPGSPTTAGSGGAIDNGKGSTGIFVATSGTAYTLTEVMVAASGASSLGQYSSTVTCSNQGGTDVSAAVKPGDSITPKDGDVISCTITNTPKPPKLKVSKALGGTGRISAADQFTVSLIDSAGATQASAETGGSVAEVTGGSASITALVGTQYMVGESMKSGSSSNIEQYSYPVACINTLTTANGGTNVSVVGLGGLFGPLVNGDDISCVITNTPKPAKLTLKQSVAGGNGTPPLNFDYSVNNGWGNTTITSTTTGDAYNSSTRELAAVNTDTVITVNLPAGWEFNSDGMNCGDNNGGYNGNNGENFKVVGLNTLTIPASRVRNFSDLVCTVSMKLAAPSLSVSKAMGGSGRLNGNDQFIVQIKDGTGAVVGGMATSTTSGATTIVTYGTSSLNATANTAYTLSEAMADGSVSRLNQYDASVVCKNTGVGATAVSGISALGQSITPQIGDVIACVITNLPKTPIFLTVNKVSTGGAGSFSFKGTANANGFSTDNSYTVSTTAAGTAASGTTVSLSAANTVTEIQETLSAGWVLTGASCVDNNAATSGNLKGSFGVLSGTTLQLPASTVLAGADLQCTFNNALVGLAVSGKVLIDSGAGSGSAHDGIQNGAESSQSSVAVSLTNCAGTVYSTSTSAGDGSFDLSLAGVPAGQAVCVVQTVPAGYTPVSVNVGTTPSATTTTTASITTLKFTPAAATGYSGIVLGNAHVSTLTSDGAQQTIAGQTVTYAHLYTAGSAGSVTFSTTSTDTPANTGWSSTLYLDANCSGTLDAGDTLLSTAFTVIAGQQLCVLDRVFTPAGVPGGAQDITTLKATETWSTSTLSSASQSQVLRNTDVTTISAAGLNLLKEVRQLSSCPLTKEASQLITTAYAFSGSAKPGDALEYRLRYSNNTAAPINSVKLYDAVPAYTNFTSAYCLNTPSQGITGCAVSLQPASGASTGSIVWTLSDTSGNYGGLQPSDTGSVGFCINVQQ